MQCVNSCMVLEPCCEHESDIFMCVSYNMSPEWSVASCCQSVTARSSIFRTVQSSAVHE